VIAVVVGEAGSSPALRVARRLAPQTGSVSPVKTCRHSTLPLVYGLPGETASNPPSPTSAPAQTTLGAIAGTVTIATAVPAAGEVAVTVDEAICGRVQPDPSLTIGAQGGVAFAVVTVGGTRAAVRAAPFVANRQCRFVPHVQIASPGAALTITSDDQTLHTTHAYAEDERTLFNVAIPLPGIAITRPLERARTVRLACDTHPWMRGFLVVTPELAAVTDENGRFVIDRVPSGTYAVRVWHERLKGTTEKVTVAPGATAEVALTLTP